MQILCYKSRIGITENTCLEVPRVQMWNRKPILQVISRGFSLFLQVIQLKQKPPFAVASAVEVRNVKIFFYYRLKHVYTFIVAYCTVFILFTILYSEKIFSGYRGAVRHQYKYNGQQHTFVLIASIAYPSCFHSSLNHPQRNRNIFRT